MSITPKQALLMATLEVSPDLLRELFCIPDGAEIVEMKVPFHRRGILEIKISGAGWETPEGGFINRTTGLFSKTDRRVDWGLPQKE